ncbi:MAG: MerR family transcriptional regulator [Bacillota bacterium]
MAKDRLYTVKEVAQLVGIPTATLRKWEQRYQVVSPIRMPNGYRLFTPRDLQVVRWVYARVQEGTPISLAVEAAHERLRTGWSETTEMPTDSPNSLPAEHQISGTYCSRLIRHLTAIEEQKARGVLDEAFAVLQVEQVLSGVLEPVLHEIGRLWEEQAISEYQEHFSSVTIRDRLAAFRALLPPGTGSHLITATLPGELHEIGILIVTILALRRGFRITHLSGSPSPSGLNRAVIELHPEAVLLSVTTRSNLESGLDTLRSLADQAAGLPKPPRIVVGGQGVQQADHLPEIPGVIFTQQSATEFLDELLKTRA